jgi:hypothetical protein
MGTSLYAVSATDAASSAIAEAAHPVTPSTALFIMNLRLDVFIAVPLRVKKDLPVLRVAF